MPNDLVRYQGSNGQSRRTGADDLGRYEESDPEEWDLPPEELGYGPRKKNSGPVRDAPIRRAAQQAKTDAAHARNQGDTEFAGIREEDAGDLLQTRWDWGDLCTWMWIVGMAFGFLLLVALCYFLPEGRHAIPPLSRPY